MKLRYALLICCLSLAVVLSGCAKTPAVEPTKDVPPATEEVIQPTETEGTLPTETEATKPEETEVTVPVDAETEKALSAYRDILANAPAIEGQPEQLQNASFGYEQNVELFGSHFDYFTLSDINQDGTPELIALTTVNFRWAIVSVYTYADGSAVLLPDPIDIYSHGTFNQNSSANGSNYTYICEENHIHTVAIEINPMGETEKDNRAYSLEGTTLTAVDCTVGESENTIYISEIIKANTAENVDSVIKTWTEVRSRIE